MKTKISTISITLILAGFLSATAQNDISISKKYQGENTIFESPNFDLPHLPAIKKAKSGQVWWEPDTVYAIIPYGDEFEYSVIYRLLHKYNFHGLLEERIQQRWKNDSWVHYSSFSYTYTYDSNNNRLTESLSNNGLITYIYDSNNNLLTELLQSWNNYSLENIRLISYTYDSNNNLPTERLIQYWFDSWVGIERELMTYDENGNGTSVETWLRSGSGWIPFGDISTETILYYNNRQSNFQWACHKLTASYINVSGISTAIKEPPVTPELIIYPNPTTGELRMENGEFNGFHFLMYQAFTYLIRNKRH